ncbi:MAG TPA: hypothetical protein DCR87_05285 [Acidobacteria bacterium]|nr:hypothetical protein [Acidobacteriota bacterium]
MRCQDFQKWISDRLDGNLSQKNQKKLEEHLRTCEACRRYYKDLKRIEDRVRKLPGAELPDQALFEDKLRERLSRVATEPGQEHRISWKPRLAQAWVAGLFLIAAAVYLFFQLRPAVEPEMDLAMLMSYEDSYLTLSQTLSSDENWQKNYNDDILNSIYEDVKAGELVDLENLDIYQEQNNNNNIEDSFLTENMGFPEEK